MNISTMAAPPVAEPIQQISSIVKSTICGGLIAGVLDASFAAATYVLVLRVYSLPGVLQYIASGLLGQASFQGGLATAALGVAIHFAIAFSFSAAFSVAAYKQKALTNHHIATGLTYGILIWLFMNCAVLPLSGVPKTPFDFSLFSAFLLDHAFLVGLPISTAAKWFLSNRPG
jgi:uncharacterized membrane protein YagU involved in acid resistance